MHNLQKQIAPAPLFISGLAELSPNYDVLFCDVWGVVHNGLSPHPTAVDALMRFRAKGGKVILVSNAPAPAGAVRFRLDRLKVPRKAYDVIVTSGDVIAAEIIARGGAPLFNIGPSYDRSLYREVRKIGGLSPRHTKLDKAAYVVCTGLFDPDVETPADYDPMLKIMLERQLDFLCANPDLVVHVGPKLMYCAGAIADLYEKAGGRVIQGGKPYPPIYERAYATAEVLLGRAVSKSRILVIGDALRTDIKGAVSQSLDSLFILGGIHRDEIFRSDRHPKADEQAFAGLIQTAGFAPLAVLPQLIW